jgi:hypothetical protein
MPADGSNSVPVQYRLSGTVADGLMAGAHRGGGVSLVDGARQVV